MQLDGNSRKGTIPESTGNMGHLQYLSLVENQLTGSIPASIGDMSSLINLSLGKFSWEGRGSEMCICFDRVYFLFLH